MVTGQWLIKKKKKYFILDYLWCFKYTIKKREKKMIFFSYNILLTITICNYYYYYFFISICIVSSHQLQSFSFVKKKKDKSAIQKFLFSFWYINLFCIQQCIGRIFRFLINLERSGWNNFIFLDGEMTFLFYINKMKQIYN